MNSPCIGWVCGVSMGFNFLVIPLLNVASVEVAPLDLSTMMPVLLGMLGFGGIPTPADIRSGKAR